ncbi:MAG TPA: 3-phosphoshikimate 1-carboxyvinyltransferase [Gemmatales bacterium]|nr:3-phosphoshikimate 1-carboxyvinyltransferase [Gemmatales bacterium]
MTALAYPHTWSMTPSRQPIHGVARVPGSKSLTNRCLILAALADPAAGSHSIIENALAAEDVQLLFGALTQLGIPITASADGTQLTIPATLRDRWARSGDFHCGNSGTTLRFLTALLALGQGSYRLDGIARMRERPVADLLDGLTQLGTRAWSETGNGCPPLRLEAQGLHGGRAEVRGSVSSQFLSALLMAAPLADGPETVLDVLPPLISEPYVDMTLRCVAEAGGVIYRETGSQSGGIAFRIPGRQHHRPRTWHIEPDASAASNFLAAAAVTGGRVEIAGLSADSRQGAARFVDVLEAMGCTVSRQPLAVTGGPLHGTEVDLGGMSDTLMTLAAVALFASGPTSIRNVAHVRRKESDRLAALATELRKLGADLGERGDGLTIRPAPLHGAHLQTYKDHRLAMAFALIALRVPGVVVDDPGCVAKTFPGYFVELKRLCEPRSEGAPPAEELAAAAR